MVLSGGANNGAWEAGLMWGLVNYGNEADYNWNTFSGVSAGSLNTMLMASGAPEDIAETLELLSTMWQTTTTESIWVPWPGGLTQGLTEEAGLVDNSPMVPYLSSIL
jgi:predicted acylesterase/phospholipase RssA